MKFIVDTQLPPILSVFLNQQLIDCKHTTDYPKAHLLSDKEIREIAQNENRIIITKDSDFYDFFLLRSHPPKDVLLQLGNISNNELLSYFRKNTNTILAQLGDEGVGLLVCGNHQIVSF